MQVFLIGKQFSVLERWKVLLREKHPRNIDVSNLSPLDIKSEDFLIVHLSSLDQGCRTKIFNYKKQQPSTNLIICTDVPSAEEGMQVLQSGADGYVNTYITESLFKEVIHAVTAGNIWAGPDLLQTLLKNLLHKTSATVKESTSVGGEKAFEGLSEREKEVLSVLVNGASNKEIARELEITERTVKAHMSSIFQKTGAPDRISLILMVKDQ